MAPFKMTAKKISQSSGILIPTCFFSIALLSSCTTNALVILDYKNQNQCIGEIPMASFVDMQKIESSALTFSLSEKAKPENTNNIEENFWFLKIAMGTKPTAGYGLSLTSKQLLVSDQTALIKLKWHQPSPDSISAQVITSPCIYLKVQKGKYQNIRVIDSNDQQRYILKTPVS